MRGGGRSRERGRGESGSVRECFFLHTHSVFLVQVDSILNPGNGLHGVYHAHDKVDTCDGDKPGEQTVTSAVFIGAADKRSRENEREDVEKG